MTDMLEGNNIAPYKFSKVTCSPNIIVSTLGSLIHVGKKEACLLLKLWKH